MVKVQPMTQKIKTLLQNTTPKTFAALLLIAVGFLHIGSVPASILGQQSAHVLVSDSSCTKQCSTVTNQTGKLEKQDENDKEPFPPTIGFGALVAISTLLYVSLIRVVARRVPKIPIFKQLAYYRI